MNRLVTGIALAAAVLLALLTAPGARAAEVEVYISHPALLKVNATIDVNIEVVNRYANEELRNVIVTPAVVSPGDGGDRFQQNVATVPALEAHSSGSVTLTFQPGTPGVKVLGFTVEYSVYLSNVFQSAQALPVIERSVQVEDVAPLLEVDMVERTALVFDGDRAQVTVSLANVGDDAAYEVVLVAHNATPGASPAPADQTRALGTLNAAAESQVTLYLENYVAGRNTMEVYAIYQRKDYATSPAGFSDAESARRQDYTFEVRQGTESIALRLVEALASVYEGMVYVASLEVQNLRPELVSGARIMSSAEVLQEIGALDANETLAIELRLSSYAVGLNSLVLTPEDELGSGAPVTLQFEALPASRAVRVYLASSTSPLYPAETLEFSLAVSAAEGAGVQELEIAALSPAVMPGGYYLGNMAEEPQPTEPIDVGQLLSPTPAAAQDEEPARVVLGREISFIAGGLAAGSRSLDFRVSYRLGSAFVEDQFSVPVVVYPPSSLKLIQAEPAAAFRGDDVVVQLHIANGLPVAVEDVSVVPVTDMAASPGEFFIGEMSPQDFLPAHFKVPGAGLSDGDRLGFKAVYRIGRDTYETGTMYTTVSLKERPRRIPWAYIAPLLAVVVLASLVVWRRRRKIWTS